MNRKRIKYPPKGILQVSVHIQYTAQENILVSLQKKSPFLAKFYFFPQIRAIKSIFSRYNQLVYEKCLSHELNSATQILQFFLCTSDLMNESGTFFVVLRPVHRTRLFFWINTILLVKKKLSIIYISLYSLNDLARSGKTSKQSIISQINHWKRNFFLGILGFSLVYRIWKKHIFVFFSMLIISLRNTVFLLLQLFWLFSIAAPIMPP